MSCKITYNYLNAENMEVVYNSCVVRPVFHLTRNIINLPGNFLKFHTQFHYERGQRKSSFKATTL